MSKWAGKYVIGLTGNIGTGKSVVRRMLEHLGAYGIDADTMAHRVMAKGGPGYQAVVLAFGQWLVKSDGEIDRARLGKVVFSDPAALDILEKIIHPYVLMGIDWFIKRSKQPVVVIEAIKPLETDLHKHCDSIWVTYVEPEVQIARLINGRKMSEADARRRIAAQAPQEQKTAIANVVIKNGAAFEETWKQVLAEWQIFQKKAGAEALIEKPEVSLAQGEISIHRARPGESDQIAALINHIRKGAPPLKRDQVMASFGEKAYLLLKMGKQPVGLLGFQVENLVVRTTDILIEPAAPVDKALPALINEMELASKDLLCEASLVFATQDLAQKESIWQTLGYQKRTPQSLSIFAWQEAAQESMPAGSELLFKQLRQDRILRPI